MDEQYWAKLMKTVGPLIFGGLVLVLAIFFIVREVRRLWHERKDRREIRLKEKERRHDIKGGVASENAFKRQIAFQAAVLHANSHFAEAFATICVGLMCLFLAALLHVAGQKVMEPYTWLLVAEFLVIGFVIVAISFVELIDFKFFQRDLSSEYRALLDIEESSKDED